MQRYVTFGVIIAVDEGHVPVDVEVARFSEGNSIKGIGFVDDIGELIDFVELDVSRYDFSALLKNVGEVVPVSAEVLQGEDVEVHLVVSGLHCHGHLRLPNPGRGPLLP